MYPVYISHRYRFIYMHIAKNASSTLRQELCTPRFETKQTRHSLLAENIREEYFVFAFIRHPVNRFLSAYQEISMRLEGPRADPSKFAFAELPEGSERLAAFIERAEESLWDRHIRRQVDFLGGFVLDFTGRVETLQEDLASVYAQLGMGALPELPRRRSRVDRAKRYGYDRHHVLIDDLEPQILDRIQTLYSEDLELWQKLTKKANAPRWERPTAIWNNSPSG